MKTAEDFLKDKGYAEPEYILVSGNDVVKNMIEFAKIHVEQIRELIQAKYYAGETGYIKAEEWKDILNNIK